MIFIKFNIKVCIIALLTTYLCLAHTSTTPTSPTQKIADNPKDKPIKIRDHNNETLCYIPTFSLGAEHGSYIGILNCNIAEAIPARYDVFGRLSFNINDTWLCISAPETVALQGRENDYLYLYPCVINSQFQQWKIKDGKFYSHDERYSIKDDGSYLYAANRLDSKLFEHKLDDSMKDWANTIAKPGNLSIVTSISWELHHKDGQEQYFIHNNASGKNTTPLVYNPTSGHIAQYDGVSGTLYCMYSNTGKKQWDWITWGLCTDASPPQNNRAYFKFLPLSLDTFALHDKDNNVLRVTRYGIHWGVPYTANKNYLTKDTSNSPTSTFKLGISLQTWLRFVNANIGRNLSECPARGYNKALLTQVPPALPLDFNLTEAWIQRLYDINTSSTQDALPVGICGTCLLQAFQAIAELLHNPYVPMQSGGYFFDTAYHQNPFISFYNRNSILHDTLRDIMEYYNWEIVQEGDFFLRAVDRSVASSISLLPQYDWHTLGRSVEDDEIQSLLSRVLDAPIGSVFLMVLGRYDEHTQRASGHAVTALRLHGGVVVIPANAPNLSLQSFTRRLMSSTSIQELEYALTRFGSRTLELVALGVIEVSRAYSNPFEELVSVNNCSGYGDDRRGNGIPPLPELINQCISGRCEW